MEKGIASFRNPLFFIHISPMRFKAVSPSTATLTFPRLLYQFEVSDFGRLLPLESC